MLYVFHAKKSPAYSLCCEASAASRGGGRGDRVRASYGRVGLPPRAQRTSAQLGGWPRLGSGPRAAAGTPASPYRPPAQHGAFPTAGAGVTEVPGMAQGA